MRRWPQVAAAVLSDERVLQGSLAGDEAALPFAAEYSQYLQPARRLTSSDWLESIRGFPRSQVLKQIRQPLIFITTLSFLISCGHCILGLPGLPSLAAHTLLGSGLSLLLVFRTTTAYQRFQEGRKIWNDILDLCRDIALGAALYRREAGPARLRVIRTSLQAFPFAMQRHVRAKEASSMQERLQALLEELHEARLEYSAGEKGMGALSVGYTGAAPKHPPLQIISRLLKAINSIKNCGDTFTNRERVWLLSMVTSLSHTVGRCERLVQTPVPMSYARHTSRFVSAWTLTLPLALVSSLGWLTAPVVAVITWALFGILEIGHSIEDPFRATIELTPICEAIFHDCARALPQLPAADAPAAAAGGKSDGRASRDPERPKEMKGPGRKRLAPGKAAANA